MNVHIYVDSTSVLLSLDNKLFKNVDFKSRCWEQKPQVEESEENVRPGLRSLQATRGHQLEFFQPFVVSLVEEP